MKLITALILSVFLFFTCSETDVRNPQILDLSAYDKAYEYLDLGIADSAFLKFNEAKEVFIERGDSLDAGNCLIQMGVIQKMKGDFFGAQETGSEARKYLNRDDTTHHIYISTNFNLLGSATYELGQIDDAIMFYKSAIKFANDSTFIRKYQNNVAVAYSDLEDYSSAIPIFEELLINEKRGSEEYARILTNYAKAMRKINPSYPAIRDLREGLSIRKKLKDRWGENSSYASISDYYETFQPDSSIFYAKKQYQTAKQIHSADDQIKALDRLIRLSPIDSTKAYFKIYRNLEDSLSTARRAAKNQFALIRYEVEKNKADNLRLQKDNAEHASRLVRQRAATGGIGIVLLVVVIGGRFYYKKRKQRLELEAQNKIKASQLETSRKVHDVVANGIYRVMTTIEHRKDIDRGNILDQLEDMYSKSRDISYEAEGTALQAKPYTDQISDLLKSFANESHKVLIVGNEAARWQAIRAEVKEEVLHILQELMVNMKKHSQADRVVIRFEEDDQALHLSYVDNGIGMEKDKAHGNGLTNTGNRIANLGGKIIFASEPGKGLRIDLFFPILK
ncbi:ATP-binding protein [Sphingobacterium oryzagri]|uniref:ATP-binding protein n=1 Tax=Sphingobacterium oryzagri TaxID=3025669 RepID=A0ABY7WDG3_9SPHI|nr:tetratricopeptide repeat-containing sensor histidine kinase [Sphingobacterium sp. KACC 22765]WDF67687.1 ATP-binding protein [Sphingobacterium sp. KACC 22765]